MTSAEGAVAGSLSRDPDTRAQWCPLGGGAALIAACFTVAVTDLQRAVAVRLRGHSPSRHPWRRPLAQPP